MCIRDSGLPSDRWRRLEIAFWLVAVAAFFVFPQHRVIGNLILITGLFAVSLDLILGYAGIVSLGHAAYFGMGAYVAGILAARGWGEPLSGLLAAGAAGAILGYATSFLVVRGSDLARLMVTLGIGLMLYEAANQLSSLTGGATPRGGLLLSTERLRTMDASTTCPAPVARACRSAHGRSRAYLNAHARA